MKDFKDNLFYADLQLRNALNSSFLNEGVLCSSENSKEIKSFLISAELMIKLALKSLPSITNQPVS